VNEAPTEQEYERVYHARSHHVGAVAGPIVERIFFHFEKVGVTNWTKERFLKLCEHLNCNEVELGALAGTEPRAVGKWLRGGEIPFQAKLLLSMYEHSWLVAAGEPAGPEIIPLEQVIDMNRTREVAADVARNQMSEKFEEFMQNMPAGIGVSQVRKRKAA
jgi:hypothetical protein